METAKLLGAIIVAYSINGQAFAADDSNLVGKDWGCAVLMCMSNPSGPTAEPKCKPPIEKLHKELARGHSYPSCEGANNENNYSRTVWDYYDPCPAGMVPAPKGTFIEIGEKQDGRVTVTSTGAIQSEPYRWDALAGDRACVGAPIGIDYAKMQFEDGRNVLVYSSVVWQKPQSPRILEVYVDGKLYSRTRY